MSVDLAIRGGTVWSGEGPQHVDLFMHEGRIVRRAQADDSDLPDAARTIDASGLAVLPGVIDGHVHIADPDIPEREDFTSGTAAAVSNGTTTLIEHHHSLPVKDAAFLRQKALAMSSRSLIDYGFLAHAHPDNLDELEPLWRAGIYGFKIFTCALHGAPAVHSDVMLDLFRRVAAFDGYCLVHCEDDRITAANEARLKREGQIDGASISAWRSLEAEMVAVADTTLLARLTGARIGIAHVSHPDVLDLIQRERQAGARVLAESCPHYFYLTAADVARRGPWAKFTPPARNAEAGAELWCRLRDGEIDLISADHAPATREEKQPGEANIWDAPFGIPGVETTLPLMLNGVAQGHISLDVVVRAMSEGPARLYGLYPRKGSLAEGADADLVLVDLQAERRLENAAVRARVGWTPYDGRTIHGTPVLTVAQGRVLFDDGQLLGEPGWGRYLPRPGATEVA